MLRNTIVVLGAVVVSIYAGESLAGSPVSGSLNLGTQAGAQGIGGTASGGLKISVGTINVSLGASGGLQLGPTGPSGSLTLQGNVSQNSIASAGGTPKTNITTQSVTNLQNGKLTGSATLSSLVSQPIHTLAGSLGPVSGTLSANLPKIEDSGALNYALPF